MKKLCLLIGMCTGLVAHTQSVLNGIIVKEHVPSKPLVKYHPVYPVPLHYTYADTSSLKGIMDVMPAHLASLAKYPKLNGQTFITYHINEIAALMRNLEAVSCRLLFYKLFQDSKKTDAESFNPPFLKFSIQNLQLIDTGVFPYFRLHARPFMQELVNPFYIKNTEVTNGEYREFVNAVKDSLARQLLVNNGFKRFEQRIKMSDGTYRSTINYKEPLQWTSDSLKPYLQSFFMSENQRYYKRREIDTEKLIYRWQDEKGREHLTKIYPDTLCWKRAFPESYNHPLAIMYFWHPAYDNRPVVGLTRTQVEAFMHWKTTNDNKALASAGKNYRVNYSLPNEMQWELAAAYQLQGSKASLGYYLNHQADHSYVTNLSLVPATDTFFIGKSKTGKYTYKGIASPPLVGSFAQKSNLSYSLEQSLNMPYISHKDYKKIHTITGLDRGVSEYLADEMDENYKQLLELRWKLFEQWNSPVFNFIAMQEKTLFKLMNTGTYLVRGGNWYDERNSLVEGTNAKCFTDGETTYPTLGFRYVTTVSWIKK